VSEAGLSTLALVFAAGFAGSFHCIGMCGGFACALGAHRSGAAIPSALRHLLYNSGRLVSYTFLGVLAGLAGASALASGGEIVTTAAQRLLAVLAGLLMIAMGLQLLGRLQRPSAGAAGRLGQALTESLRGVLHAPGPAAPLAFGVFNGFLPCPLVYAFVALAAAAADPAHGALLMIAFGLGTFPAMMASGLVARLRHHWRLRGVQVAGTFILLLGVVTLVRGVMPLDGHGVHAPPGSSVATVLVPSPEAPKPEHLH
jgi:uncharacterized protein